MNELEWARTYIKVLEELLHMYRRRVMELEIQLGQEPTGEPARRPQ